MGVGGQHHAPAAFTPGKDTVPIVQEAGWVSEPVWTGAENLAPTGIRSLDLPAHNESLYRLRYLGSKGLELQGGSNMTGTNCDLFTHNQSRSYLNHLLLQLNNPVSLFPVIKVQDVVCSLAYRHQCLEGTRYLHFEESRYCG
jgi:hypothetical protein